MKFSGNISGKELSKLLSKLGYLPTRQSGSHIRLTTNRNGQHHITIPNHNPLKIGTLSAIINDIAEHFDKTKIEIIKELF